jgi:hypothetical protein
MVDAKFIGLIAACAVGIYALFMVLGLLLCVLFSSIECGKIDWASAAKEGALWGLYPAGVWCVISVPYVRIQFDKFFVSFLGLSAETAVWVSFGYAIMLAAVAGMFGMRSEAVSKACVPSIDEADAFRKRMIELQRKKNAEIEAAKETTPAVTPM